MTFSLSGTTITQTGTDTNLSGLAGVSGVVATSQSDYTAYNIGNRQLHISGDLTIDPELESLIIGYDGSTELLTCSGSLTVGKAIILNGFTRYSEGSAIYFENTPQGFINRVSFTNSSNFTWNGGVISMCAGKFGFYGNNVTVRINSLNARLIYRTRDSQNQIRQETNDFISTAFDFINGELTIVGTGQQLNGYRPTHCTGALAFSNSTPNTDIQLRDYAGGGRGNTIDVKMWGGCRPVLFNSESGTALNVGPHLSGQSSSFGIVRVFQEFDLNVSEFGAGVIQDAKLWFQDYNNNNRRLYNEEAPAIDLTSTQTYTASSDASGNFAKLSVLTGSVIADTTYGSVSSAVNTGLYSWDYRSKNNNTDDFFDMFIASYMHSILSLTNIALKGAGGTTSSAVMFTDLSVSENDKAIVDAYPFTVSLVGSTLTLTGDNSTLQTVTAQQFYDVCKSYLVNNYAGEAETIVSRATNTIDAKTLNVVLDYITMTGGLKTTGAISQVNGATILGVIQDSAGDSQATITLPTGFDTASVHTSQVDADAGVNAIFTGTTVRYQSATYGGQTLWLRISSSTAAGEEIVISEDVPTGAGVYIFKSAEFSENAQIRELGQKVDTIITDLKETKTFALASNLQTQG